jgi:hypothetical protein
MKYKQEKERLDTIRRLQNKRQELLVALEMAEQRQDLARIAGKYMCKCGLCSKAPWCTTWGGPYGIIVQKKRGVLVIH